MWRRARAGLAVAMVAAGCGRIGFDMMGTGDGGPPPAMELAPCSAGASGFSFMRASPALYSGSGETFVVAGADQPRCTSRGLLLEETRTNFTWNSVGAGSGGDGLPSGWDSQHDAQVTAIGATSPSAFVEGVREVAIQVSNSSGSPQSYQIMLNVPVTASDVDYTFSWFVRSPDVSGVDVCTTYVTYWTPDFGIEIGDEPWLEFPKPAPTWTRVSRVVRAPAGTGEVQPFVACDPAANASYTLELLGPQFERGAGASTPIATTDGSATRDEDRLVIDGAAWMASGDGTLAIDLELDGDADRVVFVVTDASGSTVYTASAAGGQWRIGGASGLAMPSPVGGPHRIAVRFADPAGLAIDGAVVAGGSLPLPAGGSISIGALNGTVAKVRYWPEALDDAALAAASD